MIDYDKKVAQLKREISQIAVGDLIVAFSGGADSSLLLTLAAEAVQKAGTKVYAVMLVTSLHPCGEKEKAGTLAGKLKVPFLTIETDELEEAGIMDNPPDRCYRCKKYLFGKILEKGKELGVQTILEGTNEDDMHVYRPGIKAVKELGILSPLAQAGLTKQDVRRLGRSYGIETADKPASPCLATRFPYGTRLEEDKIRKVEQGEAFLKGFGLYNVRLRVHQDLARIETDEEFLPIILENKKEIITYLKNLGFSYITLDLEGFRSGSMDEQL